MQYNSNPDSLDIVSLIGDMTAIDTTNEIKQITRAANEAVRQIWSWIFQSYGGWQYDSINNSDMPVATTGLVADQQQYTLPSEALTIKAVEYKNSGGEWTKLMPVPVEVINQYTSEKEYNSDPSEPSKYTVIGNVIKLYPASDTTRASSLRVQFDRGSTTFLPGDISKTPGFVSEFHEAVAVGASYFIATNKKLSQLPFLRDRWIDYEDRIKDFYIKKWEEEFPPKFGTRDTLQEYI